MQKIKTFLLKVVKYVVAFIIGIGSAIVWVFLIRGRNRGGGTNVLYDGSGDANATGSIAQFRDGNIKLEDIGKREDDVVTAERELIDREREVGEREGSTLDRANGSLKTARNILDSIEQRGKKKDDNS